MEKRLIIRLGSLVHHMTGETTLRKLQTVSRYAVWAARVTIIIVALGMAVNVTGVALCYVDPGFCADPLDNRGTAISALCNIVTMSSCLWCSVLGYNLVLSIRDGGSPFVQKNVERMRDITATMGFTFIALVVIQPVLCAILSPEIYIFDFPLHILILTAVMFIFTLLFEYGTALQTESDEFL